MPWYRHFLWPFALLYGSVVWLRNRLFDLHILASKRFEVPVICIGNLETGGTGKSPLVSYVVGILLQNGRKVAIISRGYGRFTKGFKHVEAESSASEVGDEPLQLKLRHPQADVVVCENRVIGIERLLAECPELDVVIMDDGFQHRWVKPSLSVLVTPSSRPFWKNHLLPVGDLRESRSEAKRAQVVVLIGENELDPIDRTLDQLIFRSNNKTTPLQQFSGPALAVGEIRQVVLLSGIANSHRFEASVAELYDVVHHLKFGDHHVYTSADLLSLRNLDSFGSAVNAVITTEKDAARLRNSPVLEQLIRTPMFFLPIEPTFSEKQKHRFDKLILEHGKNA